MPSYFPENNTPQVLDTEVRSLQKVNGLSTLSLGQYGATHESGTSAVTGTFGCITALEDSVFTSLTASNWSGDTTTLLPLKAGVTIFGAFTGFQLLSGRVVAYKNG